MSLLISFKSELLKTRRTSSSYLCLIGAGFLPLMHLVDFLFDDGVTAVVKDPWNLYLFNGFEAVTILILPLYIVLLCTLIPQIEFRNNTWKQVLTSPQLKREIFIAKFLTIQTLVLGFLVLYNSLLLLSALAAALFTSSIDFFDFSIDWAALFTVNAKAYVATFAISTIQFWLGLRFKNFMASLAIGFGMLTIAGMILFEFNLPNAWLFPYTFPLVTVLPKFENLSTTIPWISLGYGTLFLSLAFIDFKRKTTRN
ncbi:ABC transporter permease [Flavitalea sp.]|nr:ABC transporter permease [Flavitalea sp.]